MGQVLLDDHRSRDSFVEKYKFTPPRTTAVLGNSCRVQTQSKELEL